MNDFVFHEEYISDIPSDRLAEFEHYIIEYGLFGKLPELTGFELTFWKTIQRRIDGDKINYDISCLKQKINAIQSRIRTNKASENDLINLDKFKTDLNNLNEVKRDNLFKTDLKNLNKLNEKNNLKLTHHEYEFEFDSEFEFESEYEYESDNEKNKKKALPLKESPQIQNYSKQVFNLLKDADLPCAKGNEISFLQTDFNNGLRYLHSTPDYAHIHSDDVIGAVKNYIEVYSSNKTYITGKMNFLQLVKSKLFYQLLPANYDFNSFVKYEEEKDKPAENKKTESKVVYTYYYCPKCNSGKFRFNSLGSMAFCESCNYSTTPEELFTQSIELQEASE